MVATVMAAISVSAQENTITTLTFTEEINDINLASDNNSITEIRFFDTAGRLRQTLRKGFSPDGSDLVDFIEFDSLGRKCTEYDPMPVSGNNGNFVQRSSFVQNNAWSRSFEYESSSLGRPLSVSGQYYGGGTATYKYGLNSGVSQEYNLYMLVPTSVPNCIRIDIQIAPSGTYHFSEYKDEDGHRRITFSDTYGKIVLERVVLSSGFIKYCSRPHSFTCSSSTTTPVRTSVVPTDPGASRTTLT